MDKPKSGLLIIAEPAGEKKAPPPLKPFGKGGAMTSEEHKTIEKGDPEESSERPLYEMADMIRERLGLDCDPADYPAILKGLKSHLSAMDGEEEAEEPAPPAKGRSAEAQMADGDTKDVY